MIVSKSDIIKENFRNHQFETGRNSTMSKSNILAYKGYFGEVSFLRLSG